MKLWGILKGLLVQHSDDRTKELTVEVDSSATTSTRTTLTAKQTANRTLTLPDSTDTLVGKQTTDALDAKIDSHLADPSDAHDASSISVIPDGGFVSTDVQSLAAELDQDIQTVASDLTTHITDPTDAHDASAISNVPSGNLTSTNQQDVNNELQADIDGINTTLATKAAQSDLDTTNSTVATKANQSALDAHVNDTIDAHDASAVSFFPYLSLDSTDLQAVVQELKDEVDALTLSNGGNPGTVTSVSSTTSDIAVSNPTSTPTLTLNSGTGANQILKLNGSAQIPAVDASLVTLSPKVVQAPTAPVLANAGQSVRVTSGGNAFEYFTPSTSSTRTFRSVTTSQTLTTSDDVVKVDTTSAPLQINLPNPTTCSGKAITILKTNINLNAIEIFSNVTGQVNYRPQVNMNMPGEQATFVSDGTNWFASNHTFGVEIGYTPTMVGQSNANLYYCIVRKVGRYARIKFGVSVFNSSATPLRVGLPSGVTGDVSHTGGSFEVLHGNTYSSAASAHVIPVLNPLNQNDIQFVVSGSTGTGTVANYVNGNYYPLSANFFFTVDVPILHWNW